MIRRILAAFAAATIALLWAMPAGAHTGSQSYLYLDVGSTELAGRVEFPVVDAETLLDGVDLQLGGEELDAALEANAEVLQAYAAEHLSFGEGWAVAFDGIESLSEDPDEPELNYVVLPFTVDESFDDGVPRDFEVSFDPFFDTIDDRDALVIVANDWAAGVFNNEGEVLTANDETGSDVLVRFTPDERTRIVELDEGSWWKTVSASIGLGVDHIRTGPDHILFVLVLLLPSVLVFGAGWQPAPTFGSALWRVLEVVSMFTVAHTITFSLAGLGILPLPPSKLVESVIAISIALAALHNLRPVVRNREWMLAFGFGLFHGMGFASLVEDLQVARSTQLLSLLGRNIGIEIGQVLVVLAIFPALYFLRRTSLYDTVFTIGSIVLAVVSVGWMIERVFELDLGISGVVDPILEVPRILIPLALVTVFAWWWSRREEAAGKLKPVGPERRHTDAIPTPA